MAEPQQPEEQPDQPAMFQRVRNFFTHHLGRVSRHVQEVTGVPLRFRRTKRQRLGTLQPIKRGLIQKRVKTEEGLFKTKEFKIGKFTIKKREIWKKKEGTDLIKVIGQRRVEAVIAIENSWDTFESYDPKTGAKGFVQTLEDLYRRATIFIDPEIGRWEYPLYEHGVTQADAAGIVVARKEDDQKPITTRDHLYDEFTVQVGEKLYAYPVPAKCKIRYSIPGMKREWIVEISPFGYRRIELYREDYENAIHQICEGYQKEILADEPDAAMQERITANIEVLENAFKSSIAYILPKYLELESRARSYVKGGEGPEGGGRTSAEYIGPTVDKMQAPFRAQFSEKTMIYPHNYEIIQPVAYGKGYWNAEIQDELRKYDGYQNPGGGRWYKKPDEVDHGLDRYGFPLEVDIEGYVMIDKHDENGNPTPKKDWRQLPGGAQSKFKKQLDALEMANYIANMHDSRRDDLRDGRYHYNTLTIMEYVETNNKSIWNLWRMEDENKLAKRGQKTVEIDLLRPIPRVNIKRSALGTYPVPYKVVATDKNPAFDLRYLTRKDTGIDWRHIGRKYYYEVPDHEFAIAGQNKEPHISSRGISMYIIEKLTREIAPWNEVMEELKKIGEEMGGFDYGVRPWDMWGKVMPKNVFEWRNMLDRINKVIEPKKTVEGYREMYSFGEH